MGAARGPGAVPHRLHLSVDDGGHWLVVIGRRVVLGLAGGGRRSEASADVGFFGELEPRHATLELRESFRDGAAWHLALVDGRGLELDGPRALRLGAGARALPEVALVPGDRVLLTPKLAFVFDRPDPASASATLTLERGVEVEGAPRVLLVAPGPEGRVRMDAGRSAHIRVLGHSAAIELVATSAPDVLVLTSDAGWVEPAPPGAGQVGRADQVRVTLPLTGRIDLTAPARASGAPEPAATRGVGLPPFGISLAPSTA
ncbi:MAG: hypothetical protein R3F49_01155 [Planctomycetota bacterium]